MPKEMRRSRHNVDCASANRAGEWDGGRSPQQFKDCKTVPEVSRRLTLLTWRRTTLSKSPTAPRAFMVADAHADRLERNQRPQSDQAMAAKLIRALLAGRAASDVIVLQGE
jgi:hypothetical protein